MEDIATGKDQDPKDMDDYTYFSGVYSYFVKREAVLGTRMSAVSAQAQKAIGRAHENASQAASNFQLLCSTQQGRRPCTPALRAAQKKQIDDLLAASAQISAALDSLAAASLEFDGEQGRVTQFAEGAGANLPKWRKALMRTLELCISGSLGFWITIGLLAGWAVQKESNKMKHQPSYLRLMTTREARNPNGSHGSRTSRLAAGRS